MRLLLATAELTSALSAYGGELDLRGLAAAYAPPSDARDWLRVNMVSTLDGAATGPDGVSGSINTPADKIVFDLLRALSDVLVIGAGTARIEGYGPLTVDREYAALRADAGHAPRLPIALVTRSGELPERLLAAPAGAVLAITHEACPRLNELRSALGPEQVVVAGRLEVDLPDALAALRAKGFRRIHSEGGPHLLGRLLAAGQVDELCLTIVPTIVGGDAFRIVTALDQRVRLDPHVLVEADGDLIGRWLIRR